MTKSKDEGGRSKGVFDRALLKARETDELFFLDFRRNGIATRLDSSDLKFRQKIREVMESSGGLFCFSSYGTAEDDRVRDLLDSGRVAAIDSTDKLPQTTLMNSTVYAAGVSVLTSQKRSKPEIYLTATDSRFVDGDVFDSYEGDDLEALIAQHGDQMDRDREQSSWSATFREYKERELALDRCDADIIIIDGPLVTQNLMTQIEGRKIIDRLLKDDHVFVGIIKDLSGSWALSRWTSLCLKPDEFFIVCPLFDQYARRFENADKVLQWVSQSRETTGNDFIRCVYQPKGKSFGFECSRQHLETVVSLLRQNASPALNHETPLLLELVDAHLRAGNNSGAIQELLIGAIGEIDPLTANKLTNERNLR